MLSWDVCWIYYERLSFRISIWKRVLKIFMSQSEVLEQLVCDYCDLRHCSVSMACCHIAKDWLFLNMCISLHRLDVDYSSWVLGICRSEGTTELIQNCLEQHVIVFYVLFPMKKFNRQEQKKTIKLRKINTLELQIKWILMQNFLLVHPMEKNIYYIIYK